MSTLLKPKLSLPKAPVCASSEIAICHTCNSPINDLPHRFLVVKDEFNKHKMLSFHYFFPCWDIDFVCQNLTGLKITKAGFICDSSIKKNQKAINNFQKNTDLWDI